MFFYVIRQSFQFFRELAWKRRDFFFAYSLAKLDNNWLYFSGILEAFRTETPSCTVASEKKK